MKMSMDISKIGVGDKIKVRVATRSGWIRGWRVVNGRWNTVDGVFHTTIRAHGWDRFEIRPHEILDILHRA
jgi:hypothetical protein